MNWGFTVSLKTIGRYVIQEQQGKLCRLRQHCVSDSSRADAEPVFWKHGWLRNSVEGPTTRGVRPASNNPWMGATCGQGAVRLKDYSCNKILPEGNIEVLIPIYSLPVGSTLTKGQAFYDFALQIVIG